MKHAQEARKINEMLEGFDEAMLCTRNAEGQLRSRPMGIADVGHDNSIYFATDVRSGKIDEIELENEVNVALQGQRRYLSISGKAVLENDREKIRDVVGRISGGWFDGDVDDPSVRLLRVRPERGEYWDLNDADGIRYLWEAGKALATGEPIGERGEQDHAKARL